MKNFIEKNLSLARWYVDKFYKHSRFKDDILQEAYIGIFLASRKFDKKKGSFSTIALYYMISRILKFIKRFSRPFSIPIRFLVKDLPDIKVVDIYEESLAIPVDYEEEMVNKLLVNNILSYAKSFLSPRDYNILLMRYFGYTLTEIGNEYNLSKERVRQILDHAYNKIKRKFKEV